MNKKLLITLTMVLMISMVSTAYADGTAFEVDEYDFKVSIPDGWITFTRNMQADDPLLLEYGMNAETLTKEFELRSTYIDAVKIEPVLSEISVSVSEDRSYEMAHNYNLRSDDDLKEITDAFLSERGKSIVDATIEENQEIFSDVSEMSYNEAYIYRGKSYSFIIIKGSYISDNQKVYVEQYQTVVNGVMVSIVFSKYGSELNDDDREVIRSVSNSLEFGHIEELKRSLLSRLSSYESYSSIGLALVIAGAVIFIAAKIINRKKAN